MTRRSLRDLPLPIDPVDVHFYRNRTIWLLKSYMFLAMQTGRLPSLIRGEFFRGTITPHSRQSFEDSVIFVLDMERCLDELAPIARKLISFIVLQGHSQEETIGLLQIPERTLKRQFALAIDDMSSLLLRAGIMPPDRRDRRKSDSNPPICQAPQAVENLPTS